MLHFEIERGRLGVRKVAYLMGRISNLQTNALDNHSVPVGTFMGTLCILPSFAPSLRHGRLSLKSGDLLLSIEPF
jgi:hypothetical protein